VFRGMRRFKQQLSQEESIQILEKANSGVLAVSGDDGYPYAVPMCYVYADGKIYFHCAQAGHKLDAIKRDNKVSFCVVAEDTLVAEEYTTYFRSVIAFGKIRILTDDQEKWDALDLLSRHYVPHDTAENREMRMRRQWNPTCLLEMEIEHMTGKESIELVKARKAKPEG